MAKLSIVAIMIMLLISSIQRTNAQFGRIKKGVPISIPQEVMNGDDMMNIDDIRQNRQQPQQQ
jgi:hypothetical protein